MDLWPDINTARSFLLFLSGASDRLELDSLACPDLLAPWLIKHGLGSLGFARCQEVFPELADCLRPEWFVTAAQNSLHWQNLRQIDAKFSMAGLPAVLLKGAALASTVYEAPEQRSMADVDLWLREWDISQGCMLLSEMDFVAGENVERPLALQRLAGGEIQFSSRKSSSTLVELHLSPFEGWWLKRTAAVDDDGLWGRKVPLAGWNSFWQLAAEDMLLQVAIHLAIGHQFGIQTMRSLIDIALIIRLRKVEWRLVVERAAEWRVATAIWLVLYHAQQLVGVPGLETVIARLQPGAWRRRQLLRLVSPESVLAGRDISNDQQRFVYLLMLVDRLRDAGNLAGRTMWPEGEWLDARYGGGVDHWQHLQRLFSQRDV